MRIHAGSRCSLNYRFDFNPKDAIAYCNRDKAYYGKADLAKTIADCTKAIRLDPPFSQQTERRIMGKTDVTAITQFLDDTGELAEMPITSQTCIRE